MSIFAVSNGDPIHMVVIKEFLSLFTGTSSAITSGGSSSQQQEKAELTDLNTRMQAYFCKVQMMREHACQVLKSTPPPKKKKKKILPLGENTF